MTDLGHHAIDQPTELAACLDPDVTGRSRRANSNHIPDGARDWRPALTRPYMRRRASQFARECDAEIVVGQDLVVGLHGRVLYLCGRCGNQCMAADAFRHLVKLRPLAGYVR
jgi:hypothetical protein